jgi:hypothetical protein
MPRSDFNGDGFDDLLWRDRFGGQIGNWLGHANGTFTDNSANSLIGVPLNWEIVATGDFNGDGNDDIAWYNSTSGQLGNWFGQDDGGWVINDTLIATNGFRVLFTADFNGDGRDELLTVGNAGGTHNVYDVASTGPAGDGDFGFGLGAYAAVSQDWYVAGIGDFNGDGRDDILWRNINSGAIGNWLTNGTYDNVVGMMNGIMDDWTINVASIRTVGSEWQIIGVGDFNGDGYDDILWHYNAVPSATIVGTWLGGPGGIFTVNDASIASHAQGEYLAQIGDFNGDGIDDLLWRDFPTGQISTWHGTESGVFADTPLAIPISNNWVLMPDYAGILQPL